MTKLVLRNTFLFFTKIKNIEVDQTLWLNVVDSTYNLVK